VGHPKAMPDDLAQRQHPVEEQKLAPWVLPHPHSPLNDLIVGSPVPSVLQP